MFVKIKRSLQFVSAIALSMTAIPFDNHHVSACSCYAYNEGPNRDQKGKWVPNGTRDSAWTCMWALHPADGDVASCCCYNPNNTYCWDGGNDQCYLDQPPPGLQMHRKTSPHPSKRAPFNSQGKR